MLPQLLTGSAPRTEDETARSHDKTMRSFDRPPKSTKAVVHKTERAQGRQKSRVKKRCLIKAQFYLPGASYLTPGQTGAAKAQWK
jgi:hypothetical protein